MAKARVLAVDDQRYFRELIEGVLTDEGYEVVTASTGEEALHVLDRSNFEIVLTDLVMPGMDGVELVRRIKQQSPDQEIVMVTGVSDVGSAIEAMKQGATDYLLKPLDHVLLAKSLDSILHRRRLAQEHARLLCENEEYLAALALYDRAAALLSTLAIEPLGERFIQGLCRETRSQAGVLWVASELSGDRLELVAATGIVRVDQEPMELQLSRLGKELAPLGEGATPLILSRPADDGAGSVMFVPLRRAGELIGLARLSDKLEGEDYADSDRMLAQSFTRFGELAVGNALQFRDLERRSLLDTRSGAYTQAYFEDVVRNEIQKANRFGRAFSIAQLHLADASKLREEAEEDGVENGSESVVQRISRVLRSTDLLCANNDGSFNILLAETDAAAAEVLLQRMREAFQANDPPDSTVGEGAAGVVVDTVTYPSDGTQLESLREALEARIAEQRSGRPRPGASDGSTLADTVKTLTEQAKVVPPQLPRQVLDFLIDEATRRPSEQGMLFVAPGKDGVGTDWCQALTSRLDAFGQVATQTQVVVATSAEDAGETGGPVTWVPDEGLGTDRLCLVYWGERPAYALLAGPPTSSGEPTIFHTADRAVVQQLANQLQRELAGVPELAMKGSAS